MFRVALFKNTLFLVEKTFTQGREFSLNIWVKKSCPKLVQLELYTGGPVQPPYVSNSYRNTSLVIANSSSQIANGVFP